MSNDLLSYLPSKATQDEIKTNVDSVKTDVASVKTDVSTVNTNVTSVKNDVASVHTNVDTILNKLNNSSGSTTKKCMASNTVVRTCGPVSNPYNTAYDYKYRKFAHFIAEYGGTIRLKYRASEGDGWYIIVNPHGPSGVFDNTRSTIISDPVGTEYIQNDTAIFGNGTTGDAYIDTERSGVILIDRASGNLISDYVDIAVHEGDYILVLSGNATTRSDAWTNVYIDLCYTVIDSL